MQPDNLYPNDGTYFAEPVSQVKDRQAEKAKIQSGLQVLKDMVKRLNKRIDFYERHSNIPDEVRTDPEKFLIMSNSHTMTAASLREEKEYIEGLIDEAK